MGRTAWFRTRRTPGVLIDRRLDRHLADHGYAVFPLLDTDEVRRLRDAWDELALRHPPVYDPTGLATTLRHPPVDAEADAAIRPVIAAALRPHVVDRVPLMSAFLIKRPDSERLPAHLDWSLVDETIWSTHGCWVPLEDMDSRVGALGVVPGSHRLVDFERSPESPGHEWTADLVDGGATVEVLHVRAGEAVFYDHRLVHFSERNVTGVPRVAVNSGVAPSVEAEPAREKLVAMMARGMSDADGGSQINPG